MAGVEITNLSKRFRNPAGAPIPAVVGLNLSVPTGELLVLVGPSACGKTTTLRLLAGLEEPDAGVIALDGRVINQMAPRDRGMAMVFQSHALYPHLTVRENLASGLRWRAFPRAEASQRVTAMAELLGLAGCLDRLPETLSGGQRQRVALGRALVLQPGLLLLDEPLSNLDASLRLQLRREIVQLNRRLGTTMIYVTHDQQEAMAIGRRIAVMSAGTIQQAATPAELYQHPVNRFVAGFIGSPPMNFLPGTIQAAGAGVYCQPDGLASSAGGAPVQVLVTEPLAAKLAGQCGRRIVLGIRPEHIAVRTSRQPGQAVGSFEAEISGVEPAGAETILHFNSSPQPIVARTAEETLFEPGQRVGLAFDPRQARFFDADTGVALQSGQSRQLTV